MRLIPSPSQAAKSKIQNSLKMMNLHQKMRRPSGESELNTSSFHEINDKGNSTVIIPEKTSNQVETKKAVATPNTPEILPVVTAKKGNLLNDPYLHRQIFENTFMLCYLKRIIFMSFFKQSSFKLFS